MPNKSIGFHIKEEDDTGPLPNKNKQIANIQRNALDEKKKSFRVESEISEE